MSLKTLARIEKYFIVGKSVHFFSFSFPMSKAGQAALPEPDRLWPEGDIVQSGELRFGFSGEDTRGDYGARLGDLAC